MGNWYSTDNKRKMEDEAKREILERDALKEAKLSRMSFKERLKYEVVKGAISVIVEFGKALIMAVVSSVILAPLQKKIMTEEVKRGRKKSMFDDPLTMMAR